ncbi:MAG: condensation domain-containing protein, partial [Pseudomonadota bacterium]
TFADELDVLYRTETRGKPHALPSLPITYKDYAVWQGARHRAPDVAAALDRWTATLTPPLPALSLPTDRPRPETRSGRGKTAAFTLSSGTTERLDRLAEEAGATPAALFLAVLAALLHGEGGDTDIIIAMPTAGRDRPELEPLVGNFLGTLPIRVSAEPDAPFAVVLDAARARLGEALGSPPVPFDVLLDRVRPPRRPGRGPLADVMLLVQNHHEADVRLGALRPLLRIQEHAKVDLTFEVRRLSDAYEVVVEYDTALFDPATVTRLFGRFEALATSVAADGGTHLSLAALAARTATHPAPTFCAPFAVREEETSLSAFLAAAESAPDATALETEEGVVSYRALRDAAAAWAAAFDAKGVEDGDRVALGFGNDPRQVSSMLGAWWVGAVPMPFDPEAAAPRRKSIFELVEPKTIAAALPVDGCATLTSSTLAPAFEGPVPARRDRPEGDAYVFPTSGSTGAPKAVLGRHGSLAHFIRWQHRQFGLGSSVRAGFLVGFTFDASLRDILVPLMAGGTLAVPTADERADLGAFASFVSRARLSILHTVPSVLRPLTRELASAGPLHLSHVFVSGEPLLMADARRVVDAASHAGGTPPSVVNFYGSTETTMIRTFHEVTDAALGDPAIADEAPVPAGRPIADTKIAIAVTEDGRVRHAAPGEQGEILVRTPTATKGYLNEPDLTAAVFVQNPFTETADKVFRSGDLGTLDHDGVLHVFGRLDRMVKRDGVRVDLGEIERVVQAQTGVAGAAVTMDGELVAHVALEADAAPDVRAAVRDALGAAAVPARVVVWPELPRLPSGKTDRSALQDSRAKPAMPAEADRTATVSKLFAEVLGLDEVPEETHLFDLGGSSLNAMTLLPRLNRALGTSLSFSDFMAAPTVRAVATAAGNARALETSEAAEAEEGGNAAPGGPELTPIPDAASYAVSPAQKRMWLLHGMDAAAATFNIKRAWDLTGRFDPDALQAALDALLARHESLRTTFRLAGGEVRQIVHPPAPFALGRHDVSNAEDPEGAARAIVREVTQTPFDLENGPLLRVSLIALSDERQVIAVALHHIVADGWSMVQFDEDVIALYRAARGDGEAPQPLAVQARDVAAWQNARAESGALNDAFGWWERQLAGPLPQLSLPLDHPRPPTRASRGAHVTRRLPKTLSAQLSALARQQGTSLFAAATAALSTLLWRLTGERDVIVGTAVAGRDAPELTSQIGFHVNAVALRTPVDPDVQFKDAVAATGRIVTDALSHADAPFDALVERLDLPRDLSRTPVFDVAIQLLHGDFGREKGEKPGRIPGVKVRRFPHTSRTAQYDLTLFLREDSDGIFIIAEYNADILTGETVARWLGHYRTLLEAAATSPHTPLSDLPVMSPAEEAAIASLEDGGDFTPPHETLVDLFEASAAKHPDIVAVSSGTGQITYGALDREANRVAQALAPHLTGRGTPVALLMDRGPEFVASMVGAMKAGGAFLPLDPEAPAPRNTGMLRDAGAAAIVSLKAHMAAANRLLWEGPAEALLVLDAECAAEALTPEPAGALMSRDLWEAVGARAQTDVEAGGWTSSFTGAPLSETEMEEYAANALDKLRPHLSPSARVLEIGCASGFTLRKVAPHVAHITGIDLSQATLDRLSERLKSEGTTNVTLKQATADAIEGGPFDLVILNSVVQAFPGVNYLRSVLAGALAEMADGGVIFLGDLMDAGLKEALERDLHAHKRDHPSDATKLDLSAELFLSPEILRDVTAGLPVSHIETSRKTGSTHNELTRYRFDALLKVGPPEDRALERSRLSRDDLGEERPLIPDRSRVKGDDPAYVIFTSGSTGAPKGVVVPHRGIASVGAYVAERFGVCPGTRVGQVFSQVFDGAVWDHAQAFAGAGTLVVANAATRADPG